MTMNELVHSVCVGVIGYLLLLFRCTMRMVMKVQRRRKRGRPKRRWFDKVKDDIKEKGLSADDVYDRATWRRMSSYIDPT